MRGTGSQDVTINELEVYEAFGKQERILTVPLVPLEGTGFSGIKLVEDGILWEDTSYDLSFEVESALPVLYATMSVNEHDDLRTEKDELGVAFGGTGVRHRYAFCLSEEHTNRSHRLPFSLTCGFARVQVHLHLLDGSVAAFESHDIVCLDEPYAIGDGQHGERAEEGQVRSMLKALVEQGRDRAFDQAAEWMFAYTDHASATLSADDETEWAHANLRHLLEASSDVLDLVNDGIEDETDGFPNESQEPGLVSTFDTTENRAVRALLVSLFERLAQAKASLGDAVVMQEQVNRTLSKLLTQAGTSRRRSQSLPVMTLLDEQLKSEHAWLAEVDEMAWRAEEALLSFDELVGGAGCVTPLPFAVPVRTGAYVDDERYGELYEAMCRWQGFDDTDVQTHHVALHLLKPDRLYEYSALQRMLAQLYRLGFREDPRHDNPIARYDYRARRGARYQNEWRCANTYHLSRVMQDGEVQDVSLYYQPLVHATRPPENGVKLRRVSESGTPGTGYWTPDYLLRVHSPSEGTYWYALDAKYCRWKTLHDLEDELASCVHKYLECMRVVSYGAKPALVDGVWILSGRLADASHRTDEPTPPLGPRLVRYAVSDGIIEPIEGFEDADPPCGIASWNTRAGSRKMSGLFALWGLD